ncbi:MAG TPA: serine hydrolase domain-containing protein [Gemmatimonadales bacterium]|nr:serine hydrolase domain-containing protein [Gemmatimonadales bacterium]
MLLAIALALFQSPAPAQQGFPDSTRIALNRVFATWTSTSGPGCAAGVSRNGELVFQNGYGMANLEHDIPITPATIFHVASVSKQFTAMAIMLLAADGKLSLDDDIRKHLPELPDYGHVITIRHLLTHTSGLRDQWDLLIMARGGRFEENRITEADVLEIVPRQKALNFVPGTEYLYSNTGYTLAGTIVRRVSGKSLRAFADERIFRPLGMTSTHFHDDYNMIVKGKAAGYARVTGGWRVSLPNYDTYGATSLFTTVGDLLKWEANHAKPVVGTEPLLRQMATSATLASGDTTGYGLGLGLGRQRGVLVVSHSGGDAGYRTWSGRAPEHGLAVTVLCNASTAIPGLLAEQMLEVLLAGKLAKEPAPARAAISLTALQLAPFAGVYENPRTGAPQFVTLRRDTLVLGRVNGPALLPMTATRFRVANTETELEFRPDGSVVQTFLGSPPRAPVVAKRVAAAAAGKTRAELTQYAGTYQSDELGVTYQLVAGDSSLTIKTRWGVDRNLQPVWGDVFGGAYLVRFTRKGGKIDGFLMSSGRVRGVRFERTSR